jgi:anti-sigma factor RsiW
VSIPDETLMAYADGELDAAERARVEAAIAADPSLARRVETHRALRLKMSRAFASVLDEPVPERLLTAVRTAPTGASDRVADLGRERAVRAAETAARAERVRSEWRWPQWSAIAAGVVLGVVVGRGVLSPQASLGPIGTQSGHLVALAALDQALTNQLASEQSRTAPVQIGVSFRAKAGELCRTFAIRQGDALSGLACRDGSSWSVRVLAPGEGGTGPAGNYQQAGSDLPLAVRAAVEAQIEAEPLDAAAEAVARKNGWK